MLSLKLKLIHHASIHPVHLFGHGNTGSRTPLIILRFLVNLAPLMGWKCCCQPFSCRCSQNVRHCRKEIRSTSLFKESMPFVKSKPPLRTRSLRSLRAAARSTSSAWCLHHAHPFVAAEEKDQSHAEKQKGWSRSCGLQDLLRTIQWLCPRFGLQVIICARPCDMWLLQTSEQLSRLSF